MLRPLPLPDNIPGKLWLTSMPGRFERLEEFLGWCRGVSVDEIVCLVDSEEIAEKSPEYGAALEAGTLPFPVEQFPISDCGVPKDVGGLVDLARRLSSQVQNITSPERRERRNPVWCDRLRFGKSEAGSWWVRRSSVHTDRPHKRATQIRIFSMSGPRPDFSSAEISTTGTFGNFCRKAAAWEAASGRSDLLATTAEGFLTSVGS